MKEISSGSVDMILSDLPYGCLYCEWDKPIDLNAFWTQANRVVKDNGAIVLTADMRLAVDLISSNRKYFRYDLIWKKTMPVGFANCRRMPMRIHELILLFYRKLPTYNPQGLIKKEKKEFVRKSFLNKEYAYPPRSLEKPYIQEYSNYPRSVMEFSNGNNKTIHPTQKPLDLFKYLILTYSNPGETVLDTCIGSGTTAVAAIETGRNFVGFEINKKYFEFASKRIEDIKNSLSIYNLQEV